MFENYYDFSANPFQLTPDARFYFESGTHRKALSYLGYGLAQGEGFIVITGEIGSGKTTLVGHLMQTIDKNRLTVGSIVTSALDAADLIQMTAESFGIATGGLDKASILKAIENFLHAEARAGRRCLLIVDEAQNLSIAALEELRMLSNFQLGGQALLQTFLLGQPEFRQRVQSEPRLEQLRQRVIATHHLDAMERGEVEPYIIHRLSKVGWQGRPDITTEAMEKLYEQTGGMPRKLNNLLSRLLLLGAVEETDMLDLAMLQKVIEDQRRDDADPAVPVAASEVATPHADTDREDRRDEAPDQAEALHQAEDFDSDQDDSDHFVEPVEDVAADEDVDAIDADDAMTYSPPDDAAEEVIEAEPAGDEAVMPAIADIHEPESEPDITETQAQPVEEREAAGDEAELAIGRVDDATLENATLDKLAALEEANAAQTLRIEALGEEIERLNATIGPLQQRLGAQEEAVKQVLAMLIDWAEHGAPFETNTRAA